MVVVLTGQATSGLDHQALITDLLPAGFEAEIASLANARQTGDYSWLPELTTPLYAEYRDDRYVAAFDVFDGSGGQNRDFTFAYLVRAVTPGDYKVPAPTHRGHVQAELSRPRRRRQDAHHGGGVADEAAPAIGGDRPRPWPRGDGRGGVLSPIACCRRRWSVYRGLDARAGSRSARAARLHHGRGRVAAAGRHSADRSEVPRASCWPTRISASARIRASIVLAAGRATWQAVSHGRIVSGASTLTMQLARLMEPSPRTLGAKLAEMGRALQIEQRLSEGRDPRRLPHLRALWRQPRRRARREPRLFRQGAAAPDRRGGGAAGRLAAGAGDGAAGSLPAGGEERARQGAAPDAGARPDRRASARDGAEPKPVPEIAPGVSVERAASRRPADARATDRAHHPDVDRRRPAARAAGDRAALPVPPRAERDHRDPGGGEQDAPGARLCRLQRFLRQPPLRAERHGDGDPLAGLGAQALHLRHGVRRAGGASRDHHAGCRAALRRLCAEEFRRPFPRPDQRARGVAGLAEHSRGRPARPGRPAALRAAAVEVRRAARVPDGGEAARPAGRARRRRHQPRRAGDALCRSGGAGECRSR